ncbi:MAG: leucine-rich repeat domain-containing protein [Clostridia bacterium]|nr:leucine-rich repeat domain-containing protein [Clostridia bacterium]
MTNELLFDMMSEIDFDLIERAEAPVPMRKKPIFRAFLIAAVLSLVLSVSILAMGIASTAAAVKRVEQNYPEFDGTVLHFAQIILTEDENAVSTLLNDDIRQALGSVIAAMRQSWGESHDSDKENTAEQQEDTREPEDDSMGGGERDPEQTTESEAKTEPPTTEKEEETTYQTPEDQAIFVHSSYDSLSMVAGEREIEVFSANYEQWRKKVEVTDSEVTHLKFRGWLAFTLSTPGTYGYRIDQGEPVYDRSFSKEPEDMVKTVSSYMGGKSCSRMEVLIPIADLAPGEHKVYICVKAANRDESNLVIFTVIIPDDTNDGVSETEPDNTNEPPEGGWSEGLEYSQEIQDGQTVYVVSGIGTCTDSELYIPPTYQGYPVVAIGEQAFLDNQTITAVFHPDTVTEIRARAYSDCYNLEQAKFGKGLVSIGDYAFFYTTDLLQIELPGSLQSIGTGAFKNSWLGEITLPDSVVSVGEEAFSGCVLLKSAALSKGMSDIPAEMFHNCVNLTDVQMHDGIISVGARAFSSCQNLSYLRLPDTVTAIGDYAFELCGTNVWSFDVVLPAALQSLGENVFAYSYVEDLVFPQGIETVPEYSFYSCQKLASVTLPASVTCIGNKAFDGCEQLSVVYFQGTPEEWGAMEMSAEYRERLTPLVVYVND